MVASQWRIAPVMLAAVVALSVGEALIAKGMRRSGAASTGRGWKAEAWAAVADPLVLGGAALLAVHLGLYAAALGLADLSLVMPLTAGSYPLGLLLARLYLHEEVGTARWVGTAAIALGVAVVAWGETAPGR